MSKHHRRAILSLCLFISGLVLAASLTGCTIRFFQPDQPKPAIEKELVGPKSGAKPTYYSLQADVMAFADEYALTIWEEMDKLRKSETDPEKRILIEYRKISLGSSAMRIAAGRNPAANLLDMLVFVTLQHMVVKEYWVPEVYGPNAQGLVEAHSRLEKEIWAQASDIVSPQEQKKLREMILEWHASHPQVHYVTDVRLRGLAELRGKSAVQSRIEVNTLVGQVEKTLGKVDEALLLGERGDVHPSAHAPDHGASDRTVDGPAHR